MDIAEQWGLPPNFSPVRYTVSNDAKNALRGFLTAGEPVVVTIANEGDTIALIATPLRLFTVKTSTLGAGAGGVLVREFPWEGIDDIRMTPMSLNVKFALHYRSNDGRTVEVGRRARLAKATSEKLMAFEHAAGEEVYRALLQIWNYKRAQPPTEN